MITYYDAEGNEWMVEGDPLTTEEEKEVGNICAIQYSNILKSSPIKTRSVRQEAVTQDKFYVKMKSNRLYNPIDDRYIVNSKPPKSQESCTTTSKKDVVEALRPSPGGEGVAQCRSDKPKTQLMKTNDDDFKKVTEVAFNHYKQFLSTKLTRYYTEATREM